VFGADRGVEFGTCRNASLIEVAVPPVDGRDDELDASRLVVDVYVGEKACLTI
jgi:hypothetical protein